MTRHEQLLEQYVEELREAKEFAEHWWAELEKSELSQVEVPEEAHKRLSRRWPDGPASHPRVLGVVRKYWLACEVLNEAIAGEMYPDESEPPEPEYVLVPELEAKDGEAQPEEEEEEEVYPHVFVLEWLMDGDHDDLADFLGSLSYWPVGLDRNDRYT